MHDVNGTKVGGVCEDFIRIGSGKGTLSGTCNTFSDEMSCFSTTGSCVVMTGSGNDFLSSGGTGTVCCAVGNEVLPRELWVWSVGGVSLFLSDKSKVSMLRRVESSIDFISATLLALMSVWEGVVGEGVVSREEEELWTDAN